MADKYLDQTGLNKLVNDYLKPEEDFDINSEHPIMNKSVTQSFIDTLATINNDKAKGYYHFATVAALPSTNSVLLNDVYQVGQRGIVDSTSEIYEVTAVNSETGDITWTKTNLTLGGGKVNATALADSDAIAAADDGIYLNVEDGKVYGVVDGEVSESSKVIDTCLIEYGLYEANKDSLNTMDILFIITNAPGRDETSSDSIQKVPFIVGEDDIINLGVYSDKIDTNVPLYYNNINIMPWRAVFNTPVTLNSVLTEVTEVSTMSGTASESRFWFNSDKFPFSSKPTIQLASSGINLSASGSKKSIGAYEYIDGSPSNYSKNTVIIDLMHDSFIAAGGTEFQWKYIQQYSVSNELHLRMMDKVCLAISGSSQQNGSNTMRFYIQIGGFLGEQTLSGGGGFSFVLPLK